METTGDQAGAGCRICGNRSGNRQHRAREMFLGTRDPFTYAECSACGTVQLRDVPDLRPYYAGGYARSGPSPSAAKRRAACGGGSPAARARS